MQEDMYEGLLRMLFLQKSDLRQRWAFVYK